MNYEFELDRDLLTIFWQQLYDNIGYSRYYGRFIVVEPLCYLKVNENMITELIPLEELAFKQPIGKTLASFIDLQAPDERLEQSFLPYITDVSCPYILLSEDEHLEPISRQRLSIFLEYLKMHANILEEIGGFIHYHINEPELSEEDRSVLIRLSNDFGVKVYNRLLGLVISEDDPKDSLALIHLGKFAFVNHLRKKLDNESIKITGEIFADDNKERAPLAIRLS